MKLMNPFRISFETEQESDGRWRAWVPLLSGCVAYGATELEALAETKALALRKLEEIQGGASS